MFRGVIGINVHNAVSSISRDLWHLHSRLPSGRVLSYLSSHIDVGKQVASDTIYDIYLKAKQTRDSFHENSNKTARIFDLSDCDIWRAYPALSSSGVAYFLTIVDVNSHGQYGSIYCWKKVKLRLLLKTFVLWLNVNSTRRLGSCEVTMVESLCA